MTKQTLYYNSAEDPFGHFVMVEDGELVDFSDQVYRELRRRAIRNFLAAILPF